MYRSFARRGVQKLRYSNNVYVLNSGQFLQFPQRKVLDPNGSYISTTQKKIWVCSIHPTYSSFYRGQENLLKCRILLEIILTCTMSEKVSQKQTAFVFGSTYLHQTFVECVSDQYTYF